MKKTSDEPSYLSDILDEETFEVKLDAYASAWLAARLALKAGDIVGEGLRAAYLRGDLVKHNAASMLRIDILEHAEEERTQNERVNSLLASSDEP